VDEHAVGSVKPHFTPGAEPWTGELETGIASAARVVHLTKARQRGRTGVEFWSHPDKLPGPR
jgi:hypothetical protein